MKCSIKTTEGRQRVEDREEKKKRERARADIGLYSTGLQDIICPASKLNKELGVSNRDIHGLMDKEAYMWKRGPGATPHHV